VLASPRLSSRTCAFCFAVLACTACSKVERHYEDLAAGNAGDGSGNTSNNAGAEAKGGRGGGGASGVIAGNGGVNSTSSVGGTINTSASAGQANIGGSSVSQAGAAALANGGNPATSTAGGSGGVIAAGGTVTSAGTPGTGGTIASAGMAARGGSPATGGALTTAGTVGTGGAATGGAGVGVGGAATGGAATGGAATGGAGPGPSVVFTVATVANGATTNVTTATFGFGSSPSGATAYQCKLNSATTFTDCTSGLALSQLSAGGQSLTVHAVNAQGTVGLDSTRTWTLVPLATTIKNIRTAASGTLDDTLVTIAANVRVTGFGTVASQQLIFVQEAGPATSSVIDTPADLAPSPVLNAGILTRALTTQSVRAAGAPVTVTGTVAKTGANLELARASYIWGTGTAVPYAEPEVRTSTVFDSRLEGVRIALAGQIPQYNCSSGCFNSSIGNASALCIETACMDSGCPSAKIVSWLNIAGGSVAPVTSGYGIWRGWLVKRSSYYEFWTDGSDSYGNDLCL